MRFLCHHNHRDDDEDDILDIDPQTRLYVDRKILNLRKVIMSELDDAVAGVVGAVNAVGARLAAEIQALEDKVNAGTQADAADVASLKALATQLQDPNFGEPVPPAPPA